MRIQSIILSAALLSVCSMSIAAAPIKAMSQKDVNAALQDNTIVTIPVAMMDDKLIMVKSGNQVGQ